MRAAPTSRAPLAATATGMLAGGAVPEEDLLGRAARDDELGEPRRIELVSLVGQPGLDGVSQREIHVVAAEQQVRTHRDARHAVADRPRSRAKGRSCLRRRRRRARGPLRLRRRRDESLDARRAGARHPVVERGLRLLDQLRRQARLVRGLDRELARDLVERGGDRQDDLLLAERRLRMSLVPGAPEVSEQALRPPRPATPWATIREPPTAGSRPRDRPPRERASSCSTRRGGPGTSAPRRRAISPSAHGASPNGSSARSPSTGAYRSDGNRGSACTSPGPTSCGTSKTRASVKSSREANATTVFVVPRSTPTAKRAAMPLC